MNEPRLQKSRNSTPLLSDNFNQFSLRAMFLGVAAIALVLGAATWDRRAGVILGYFLFAAWGVAMTGSRKFLIYMCLGLIPLYVWAASPVVRVPQTAVRRHACMNHTRHIALALSQYEIANGSYPPTYTVDADGNRLHSWRTLILPFLNRQELYAEIDLTQPWDAPINRDSCGTQLREYQCPAHPSRGVAPFTSYVAVVGPHTMWPGEEGRRLREVTDGMSPTILIVEIARTDIDWAEPRDLTFDEILAAFDAGEVTGLASYHPAHIAGVAFVDSHVRQYQLSTLHRDTLRAMLTVAGGESFDETQPENPPHFDPARIEAEPEVAP